MNYIIQGVDLGKTSLLEWRSRYDKPVYPEKLVFNMFYRAYPYEWFWENRRQFFGVDMAGLSHPTASPEDAHEKTMGLLRNIQLESVRPFIQQWMASKKDVGVLSHKVLDSLIATSQSGNNKDLEQLEYTFCYNNAVFKALNVFFAAGTLGLNPQGAFGEATGSVINEQSFNGSLNELMAAMQSVLSFSINNHYSPLENYW